MANRKKISREDRDHLQKSFQYIFFHRNTSFVLGWHAGIPNETHRNIRH